MSEYGYLGATSSLSCVAKGTRDIRPTLQKCLKLIDDIISVQLTYTYPTQEQGLLGWQSPVVA